MKSLKYIIVSIVLTLGFVVPAMNAQDAAPKAGPGQRGGDMYEPLLKGITLTPDQRTKIDTIKADAGKQIQALPQEERRAKGREMRENASGKIRAVLTTEQQATYDANKKEFDSRRGGEGGKGGSRPGKAPKGGANE